MNLVSLITKNTLLIAVVSSQMLMLFFALGEKKHIEDIVYNRAIGYHILLTLIFCIGWFLRKNRKHIDGKMQIVKVSKKFYYLSYVFSTIGLITSALTISQIYPVLDYINLLRHYQENQEILKNIKFEATKGGISGVFKMLNYSSLAVFFIVSSYLCFYEVKDKEIKNKLLGIQFYALICSLLKTFFTLDRLTILGIAVVILYTLMYANKKLRWILLISFIVLFSQLSFITSAKMSSMSVLDFIRLYCQLGFSNFELLIEHQKNFSFGFNTFLMPLYFIGVFFNLKIDIPQATFIIWDNAQYFYGYLYLDFGIFSFLIMLFLGFIMSNYQRLFNLKYKLAVSIFFVVLFAVSTLVVVPIIRGVEFWWMLVVCVLLSLFIKVNNSNNPEDEKGFFHNMKLKTAGLIKKINFIYLHEINMNSKIFKNFR